MRTTIEISDDQHETLLTLARRRGMRGFSSLVQEALDAYLANLSSDEIDLLLSLESSIDDNEERDIRQRIAEARETWRVS
ncbi:MAG: hypothetical protein ACR2ME_02115 [Acidimicrobiia bacterium]